MGDPSHRQKCSWLARSRLCSSRTDSNRIPWVWPCGSLSRRRRQDLLRKKRRRHHGILPFLPTGQRKNPMASKSPVELIPIHSLPNGRRLWDNVHATKDVKRHRRDVLTAISLVKRGQRFPTCYFILRDNVRGFAPGSFTSFDSQRLRILRYLVLALRTHTSTFLSCLSTPLDSSKRSEASATENLVVLPLFLDLQKRFAQEPPLDLVHPIFANVSAVRLADYRVFQALFGSAMVDVAIPPTTSPLPRSVTNRIRVLYDVRLNSPPMRSDKIPNRAGES
jgi:hypothetical protein